MGGIGGPEILLVFFVVLLVFGPRKLPELARGLGKGIREIRRLTTELRREVNLADLDEEERRIGPETPPKSEGASDRNG